MRIPSSEPFLQIPAGRLICTAEMSAQLAEEMLDANISYYYMAISSARSEVHMRTLRPRSKRRSSCHERERKLHAYLE